MLHLLHSLRLSRLALAGGVLLILFLCLDASAADVAVTLDTVLSRLQALEKRYSQVQLEGSRFYYPDVTRSKEKHQSTLRWLQLGEKAKQEVVAAGESTQLLVTVVNPDGTSFTVVQEDSLSKPRLALTADAGGQSLERISTSLKSGLEECRAAFWAEDESIHDLLTSGALTNIRVQELEHKIVITADRKKFSEWFTGKVSASDYEIVLNPALDYAAERFGWRMTGVDGKPFARKTRVMTYDSASNKTPALVSAVWDTERFIGDKTCNRCEFKVNQLTFKPPSESEFTLAGSGFANLAGGSSNWRNAFIIVSAAVVVFSLYGIIMLRKRTAVHQ